MPFSTRFSMLAFIGNTNIFYFSCFCNVKVPIIIKPGIHDTSFASKSPFKKTWIKKT